MPMSTNPGSIVQRGPHPHCGLSAPVRLRGSQQGEPLRLPACPTKPRMFLDHCSRNIHDMTSTSSGNNVPHRGRGCENESLSWISSAVGYVFPLRNPAPPHRCLGPCVIQSFREDTGYDGDVDKRPFTSINGSGRDFRTGITSGGGRGRGCFGNNVQHLTFT